MKQGLVIFLLCLAIGIPGPIAFSKSQSAKPAIDPAFLKGLRYRSIGPHRGGRVTAVAGHRNQPHTFYMGATGGGVWKTTDAGDQWVNMSDGFFETGGVYKSADAGKTWTHVGLREAGQIGALRVHPRDANVAYVAVLGNPFGPNAERGDFRRCSAWPRSHEGREDATDSRVFSGIAS